MPIIQIYRAGKKITSKEFQNLFYIFRDINKNELFWRADEEQRASKNPSEIQIWIRGASSGADIAYLLPNWQLVINGVKLKQGYYNDSINVGGRDVELEYDNYRFICSFPGNENRPANEITDLQPIITDNDE